ncbi:viral A-type inclusion protein [Spirosoma areae]
MNKFTFAVAGLLATGGVFWSCNSGQDALKEAENEVFAIHDKVMPRMSDVMKLKKQLAQRIVTLDSLRASGPSTATIRVEEEKEQAHRLRRNLTIADSLMSDWMYRYNGDTLAKLSAEDALRYLADQKDKVTDVQTKFNTSIEQAKQFLDKK